MQFKPYERQAHYYETDQMKIIHHSNYIRWFEEARIDFMEQMGLSYAKMEEAGIIIPVLSVSADYKAMVAFGDTVQIVPSVQSYNGVKMTLRYTITDKNTEKLRTTGTTSHCFLNAKGRPVSLKRTAPEFHEKFAALISDN